MVNRLGNHKLVLLGDTCVGKSSLVLRYVRDEFNEHCESTVGAAFMAKSVIMDGKTVKFEIWDTAGQERYRSLTPMYYRGAKAAVVMYDITNNDSFACAQSWLEELKQRASSVEVIVLVGNKLDLADESRSVSTEVAKLYAESNNMLFFEISVKENINVQIVFDEIAKRLPSTDNTRMGNLDSYSSYNSSTILPSQSRNLDRDSDLLRTNARGNACC